MLNMIYSSKNYLALKHNILRVKVAESGASCHVGYRSCFYRVIPVGSKQGVKLEFVEEEKTFDPDEVYGDSPNPTKL